MTTYLNLARFDDLQEVYLTSGSVALTSALGGSAIQCSASGSTAAYARMRAFGTTGPQTAGINLNDTYFTGELYMPALPSDVEPVMDIRAGLTTLKVELRCTSAGHLQLYDNVPNQIGTDGATTLQAGRKYRIDVYCGTGSPAAYEVKIDGTTELSGTGTVGIGAAIFVTLGVGFKRGSGSFAPIWDNVTIGSAYAPVGYKLGLLSTVSDVSGTWAPNVADVSCASMIDDLMSGAIDNDTTYAWSAALNDQHIMELTDCATAGVSGTIYALKMCAYMADQGGTTRSRPGLKWGTTILPLAQADLPLSTYAPYSLMSETNFGNGNIPWTVSQVDSLLALLYNTSTTAVEVRCTSFTVTVMYVAPALVAARYTPHAGI